MQFILSFATEVLYEKRGKKKAEKKDTKEISLK